MSIPHELGRNMICNRPLGLPDAFVPPAMDKRWRVEDENGRVLYETQLNDQRLNVVPIEALVTQLRFVPLETWGAPMAHVFALEVR